MALMIANHLVNLRRIGSFALRLLVTGAVLFVPFGTAVVGAEAQASGSSSTVFPATLPSESLLRRIVLVGASVTAGFAITEPFGGPNTPQYRLGHYVEATLNLPHDPVVTHANAFFFTKPAEILQEQLKAAANAQPSLVVALDSLFWFCYGELGSEQERLDRFEAGLRLLETLTVPVIVGDIPDASGAVGKILGKKQMPDLTTIAKCNERLMSWVADRKNVRVFPLAKVMSAASANEELKLATSSWGQGQSRSLLQRDGLHPSTPGLAALTLELLSLATSLAEQPLPDSALERNLKTVLAAAGARAKAEAEQQEEKRRRAEQTETAVPNAQ